MQLSCGSVVCSKQMSVVDAAAESAAASVLRKRQAVSATGHEARAPAFTSPTPVGCRVACRWGCVLLSLIKSEGRRPGEAGCLTIGAR